MIILQLKGGSLNSTRLHIDEDRKFVRKIIKTSADREYGYIRWYSQLKKLQRFEHFIPEHIPKVLDVGVCEEGAFFDIEYIDANDIKTLFKQNKLSDFEIKKLHTKLWDAFDKLHQYSYAPNMNSLKLYLKEEVLQKLNDAQKFLEFNNFYNINVYEHCGQPIIGIKDRLEKLETLFDQKITCEGYVHGNPTLENILYSEEKGIVFIDLYEEGIIDSKFMDYSQVLQCSNGHYGIFNDSKLTVDENVTNVDCQIPNNLSYFDTLFNNELKIRCSNEEYFLVKLFEATQFFRMLPFKCHAGQFDAAKFFYVHACALVNKLL